MIDGIGGLGKIRTADGWNGTDQLADSLTRFPSFPTEFSNEFGKGVVSSTSGKMNRQDAKNAKFSFYNLFS
jgi:hypothetical protein